MKFAGNLIVGAGIAGLTLANKLQFHGEELTVLEKSRGVGGRMATRRDQLATYDHGAQFYIPRRGFFFDILWESGGLVETWFDENGVARRVSRGGMTKLAKSLVSPEQLRLNTRACSIARVGECWRVSSIESQTFDAARVFLTCPLPQALELLRESQIRYPEELDSIRYAKSLVGLFEVEGSTRDIDGIKYRENVSEAIFSLSNQHSKGVSSVPAFTVVMQASWSETWFDQQDPAILEAIQEEFQREMDKLLGPSRRIRIRKADLKKWRFSHPLSIFQQPYLEVAPNLFLLGDAFGGPSISGACWSALQVLEKVLV